MYEIWLALNILWEMALQWWPGLAAGAVVWLVLVITAWRRPRTGWRVALPAALGAGALVAAVAFLAVPSLTRSSLGELAYWVDWANLLAIAAGFGAAAFAFAWPVLSMRATAGSGGAARAVARAVAR